MDFFSLYFRQKDMIYEIDIDIQHQLIDTPLMDFQYQTTCKVLRKLQDISVSTEIGPLRDWTDKVGKNCKFELGHAIDQQSPEGSPSTMDASTAQGSQC